MLSTDSAIPLAPSVIKSLAKRLRDQPCLPPMSVSQSIELFSRVLGHQSWHAAQHTSAPPAPPLIDPYSAARRLRFYVQLECVVACSVHVYDALRLYDQAYTKWGFPPEEALLFRRVHAAMTKGLKFSRAVEQVLRGVPAEREIQALRAGEDRGDSVGVFVGLCQAAEILR